MARHRPAPAAPRRAAPAAPARRDSPTGGGTGPGRAGRAAEGAAPGRGIRGAGAGTGRVDYERKAAGPPPRLPWRGFARDSRQAGGDGDGGSPGCRRCGGRVAVEENRILALGRETRPASLACGHGLLPEGSQDPKLLGSGGLGLRWPPTAWHDLGMGAAWRAPLLSWGLLGSGTTCWLGLCFMSSGQWLRPMSPLQATGVYSPSFASWPGCPGEPQGPWWPVAGVLSTYKNPFPAYFFLPVLSPEHS